MGNTESEGKIQNEYHMKHENEKLRKILESLSFDEEFEFETRHESTPSGRGTIKEVVSNIDDSDFSSALHKDMKTFKRGQTFNQG